MRELFFFVGHLVCDFIGFSFPLFLLLIIYLGNVLLTYLAEMRAVGIAFRSLSNGLSRGFRQPHGVRGLSANPSSGSFFADVFFVLVPCYAVCSCISMLVLFLDFFFFHFICGVSATVLIKYGFVMKSLKFGFRVCYGG